MSIRVDGSGVVTELRFSLFAAGALAGLLSRPDSHPRDPVDHALELAATMNQRYAEAVTLQKKMLEQNE